MQDTVEVFTRLQWSDLIFLVQGALKTIHLSVWSALVGTLLGILIGVARASAPKPVVAALGAYIDVVRSVPLLVQFILINSALAVLGFPQPAFAIGVLVLSLYMAAYVAEVARGGVLAVPVITRRAARSLGMTWFQDLRYIVAPLGLRAVLPAWIGLLIGLVKDTSLISVIGYIELLRAGQIIITRSQEPLLVLTGCGLFYFVICYPMPRFAARLEARLAL